MKESHRHEKNLKLKNSGIMPEVAKLVADNHTVTLPLFGYSMRPFLEDGRDKVLLESPLTIAVGDVVLAEVTPQHYALHRVVSIMGNTLVLLGDGNVTREYCRSSDVMAKAVAFYRKGSDTPDLVTGRKWRIYSCIWMNLLPVRRYLLFIHRQLKRIF